MKDFGREILAWYEIHGRDLPWRKTTDPYKIWLSEIILQQTRIKQGLSYYHNFTEKYPDVSSLARAPEEEVLKCWQGLGYYTRARNLHHTARIIANDQQCTFPDNYKDLLNLKGIGEYTAAAIASIAFDEPRAVVDGNVIRVLSRIFGIKKSFDKPEGKKIFISKANDLISKKEPGKFNQAIMDFGSIYCVPANPDCNHCIFKNDCYAFRNDQVDKLPVRSPKIKIRKRYFHYLVFNWNDPEQKTLLKKRNERDIWMNLYDFPLIETENTMKWKDLITHPEFKKLTKGLVFNLRQSSPLYKHQLTHQQIHARFFMLDITALPNRKNYHKTKKSDISKYPVSRMIEKFLQDYP